MAGLVFAVFLAYAFLTRATYRTIALVEVEPVGPTSSPLPAPLEAARRLREVVLAREVLERLASELPPSADGRAAAASQIRDALQIDTIDSRVFSVSYKDSDPERARRLCNLLARQAAERGPRALAPARSADERQQETERDQKAGEVVAFLAAHPEVALQAQAAPSGSPGREDAALSALRTERARLAQRLEALSASSDNPYAEPADATLPPEQIKKRIAEIDGVVASRRRALEQPGARGGAPSGLDEQWRKMLQSLAELPAAAPPAAPSESFKGRIASEAPLPGSPVEPNRPLVLFVGFLAALGSAGLTIIARSVGQRRGPSRSRVRAVTERLPNVRQVSVAPGPRSPSAPPLPPAQPLALPPAGQPALPDGRYNGGGTTEQTGPSAFAATVEAPIVTGNSDVAARPASSILPHAVIEINAGGGRARDLAGAAPEAARRPNKRGPTRVTQVLGSPMQAGLPNESSGSEPPPRFGEAAPAPPTERGLPKPQSEFARPGVVVPTNSEHAYASEIVGGPSPAPRRSEGYERSTALARVEPGPQVITYDVSLGWQPEPSLDPSQRQGLRDELASHFQGRCFVVGVSSGPDLSEQKSRLSVELALSLAEPERTRILVLEADFQRPTVHRLARAKLPLGSGFSQQLYQRTHSPPPAPTPSQWTVAHCHSRLDVLGESALRAPGQMASPSFEQCVNELRRFYDFIVIDGPPLSLTEECRILDRLVDGMLFFSSGSDDPAMARVTSLFSGKVFSKVVKR